ncbi:membrane protein [Arthrobacter phage MooKitty]|nr:membrane protein [Arthrobacter phage MooKitty]
MNNDGELAVAVGRIEAKQDALKEQVANNSENTVAFQGSMRDAMVDHSARLAQHETRLDGHDVELKGIKQDAKGQFTKNTVIIGLILTAVNIAIGIFGRF